MGDHQAGLIVIAVLLKSTQTVCPHLSPSMKGPFSRVASIDNSFVCVWVGVCVSGVKKSTH